MKALEYVLTALLSGIILSFVMSFIGDEWTYLTIYLFFTTITYLTGGILFSAIVDNMIENFASFKYIFSIFIYGFGGVLVNFFFYLSLFDSRGDLEDTIDIMILGIIAALLFFHVKIIISIILKRTQKK
jgi:hypothetical protein